MRDKIFRGKIRMYFSVQLYVVRDYDLKKVPESKKYLQVRRNSVACKGRKELLNLPVKAHELAYLYIGDCLISSDIGI